MAILGRFTQQPNETIDYDIDYSDFYAGRSDAPASSPVNVSVPSTVQLLSATMNGMVVKIVLTAVPTGRHKITVLQTTNAGMVKEDEFYVTGKDV
jgi:hypothetical protein